MNTTNKPRKKNGYMKSAGIAILSLGLIITIVTGLTFVTREKVLDVGNLTITSKQNHRLAWSPIVGVMVMAIGAGVYLTKGRNR